MAQITIRINEQDYKIACDDGQEKHLASLANYLDSKIKELVNSVGQVGESRLLVMACLLITDELLELRKTNLESKTDINEIQPDGLSLVEFEKLALRIEKIAERSQSS